MHKKIAFFRIWAAPPIAASVEKLLEKSFPEFEIEIIELARIVRSRFDYLLLNLLSILWFYGLDVLRGKRSLRDCFWRTPFIYRRIRKIAEQHLSGGDYAFSFQLSSMFDASYGEIPNFIYTDHTHLENLNYPGFDPSMLYSQAWIEQEKLTYQNAALLFTRSTNISRSLESQYGCPSEKIKCVYVGSNIAPLQGPLQNDEYCNKNILFVSMYWERKGGPLLIEAFKKVLEFHPDATLTVVGESPDVDIPNVSAVGEVAVADMPEYYKRASIFCLPTNFEPFGVIFIEAMAYKLPLVATKIGAMPDFVLPGENGYFVSLGDAAELAEKLITLLDDPQKIRSFGAKSYQLVLERYNWDRVGQRIRELVLSYIAVNR